MKAALFSEHGGPEVVRVADHPLPIPGAGEVRVDVGASALNHLDLWVRRGLPIETTMPHVGGSDVAGTVAALGEGVDPVWLGRRVVVDPSLGYDWYDDPARPGLRLIGEHTDGGLAEAAVVPAANLVPLPDHVSFETAAATSLVGVTAWRGLVTRGSLRAAESVLVTGASGGVGTAAVQIARQREARVFALTSGADNVRRVRELGAEFVYDRLEDGWTDRLREDTEGHGVDLILDSVGEALWKENLRALAVAGRLVTYGATTGAGASVDLRHVFWKQLSILGTTMGTPGEYRSAMASVFAGALKPVIHEVMPLDETRRAHELLEAGDVFGKIVLVP